MSVYDEYVLKWTKASHCMLIYDDNVIQIDALGQVAAEFVNKNKNFQLLHNLQYVV